MTPEELLKEVGEPFGYMIPHYADYPDVFFKHPLAKGYSALMARTKLYTSDQVAAAILKATKSLEDQLAKAEQRVAEWQPISTAPKDGRELILLLTPSNWPQVAYSNTWWQGGFSVENKPTHWMPLPTPPKRNMEGV